MFRLHHDGTARLEGLAYQLHIDPKFLDVAKAEARSNPDRALRVYAEICRTRRRLHELLADAGTRSGRSSRWKEFLSGASS